MDRKMLSARIDVAQEFCSGTASCQVIALLWRVSKRYIAVLSLCSPLAYLVFIPFPHPRLWLVAPIHRDPVSPLTLV